MNHVAYLESWLTWMQSSHHRCRTWSPLCRCQLLWQSWGTIFLGWVAMRLISSRSWRWSSFGDSDGVRPPLLDLVLHVTFACKNFPRPSTTYMFFWRCSRPSPVRISNKQNIQKVKRKLGFSKTLDWSFLFRGWSKLRDAKEKWKEKLKIFTNAN
jgi:hypothetical protein